MQGSFVPQEATFLGAYCDSGRFSLISLCCNSFLLFVLLILEMRKKMFRKRKRENESKFVFFFNR